MGVNVMPRRKANSIYKKDPLSILKLASLTLIVLLLIVGSQELLNSFPVDILVNNQTKFIGSFDSISANQISIQGNQIQISEGDVVKLSTGGYIKIKSNQISPEGDREAYKYGNFKLNQVLLFSQDIYEWEANNFEMIIIESDNPAQKIELTYLGGQIQVTTPLTNYIIEKVNSGVFITSDDGSLLYKLTSTTINKINIEAIGVYNSVPYTISASTKVS